MICFIASTRYLLQFEEVELHDISYCMYDRPLANTPEVVFETVFNTNSIGTIRRAQ